MPLPAALRQFSLQTGLQVGHLPDPRAKQTTHVRPLNGRYTAEAALAELLAGSGLSFKRVNDRTIAIVAVASKPAPRDGVSTGDEPPGRKPKGEPYLAAAASGSEGHSGTYRVEEEIFVTVSRLKNPGGEGPAPITTLDDETIEQMAASTVPDMLEYVPQQPYNRMEGYRVTGAQYAEIRGLAVDTTLVLINGRRTSPTATSVTLNAFDLNSIAVPAVERIEVLSDSASAIHGADAMGGVVNIILKKEMREPVIDLKYGLAQGGADEHRASLSGGLARERWRVGAVLDYFERDYLLGAQRDRWNNQDFRRYGGADLRVAAANPGNIYSPTPANLPGLPSSVAAVPAGSSGVGLMPGDFLATAGQQNRDSLYRLRSIVPATHRTSLMAFGELGLPRGLTAFGEFLYADRSTTFQFEPVALMRVPVPASNAFNPFGVPVAASYLLTGIGPRRVTVDTDLYRTVGGLRGALGSWDWEVSALWTDEDGATTKRNEVDAERLAAALRASDPQLALNVFQDGPGGSPALLASLVTEPREGSFSAAGKQVSAFLRGTMLTLPSGPVDAVVGAEWRKEDVRVEEAISLAHGRKVSAAFAELRVPVVGAQTSLPMMKSLSLSLAARLDEYDDFGSTFNPQYGVVWQPTADLALRASYGASFRPPSLFELHAPETVMPALLPDRRRHGEIASFDVVSRGNPDLDPTRAHSLTAGIVVTPTALSGMRVAMTYWRVQLTDRVTGLPAELILTNEDRFGDRVRRAAPTLDDLAADQPGRLLSVNVSRANLGASETDGIDLEAAHAWNTDVGQFTPRLAATWVHTFETSDAPGASLVDRVGRASSLGTIPRWRAVASLGWSRDALGLSTTVSHVPSYQDTIASAPTGRTIAPQTTVDVQASLDLDALLDQQSFWRGFRLTAGVLNLFNAEAGFSESAGPHGYDTSQGDLKQRFGYIKISKKF